MTCQDARERLSELLDGLLAEPDRRQLWGHLATCAECARELAGLRQTVALLRRVQPPRAPAGFVERLMERAAPEPWLRRALRGAFVPLGTKLPAQAAAVALLTIGTVYVFQRTPELQKAARTEVPGGWGEVPAPPPAAPRLARRSTEMGRGPSTPPLKATPPSSPGPAIPDRSAGDRPPGAHPADALPVPMTGPADPGAPPRIAPSAPQSEARPLQADESPPGEAVAIAPAPAAPAYTEAAGSRSKEAMSREKRGAREPAPPSVSPPAAGSEPAPSAGAARQETGAATSGVSALREPARRPAETM
jgi:Putative zinc-finger